jgi:hypothetical protein
MAKGVWDRQQTQAARAAKRKPVERPRFKTMDDAVKRYARHPEPPGRIDLGIETTTHHYG